MLSGGDFLLDGYVPALDAVELDDMPAWGETSENASDDLQRGAAGGPSREVVFVDPDVPDFELLLADIRQNRDPERRIDVVVLDGEGDGVRQISRHLGEYRDLDAVHLIAHGTSGQVNLGIASLSLENLDRYAGELAGWDRSLRSGADLLIYGCDLASTVEGRALVDALGAACDCDVAASDDPTGHASLGGDWKLEYATSGVETEVALSVDAQLAWPHTLAVSVDNTSTGTAAELTSGATISHATSGNNRLMLVGVSFGKDEGHTVDSITYNGTVLTLAGARDHSDTSESRVEIWGLIAPDTGTHDVVVTFSGGPYVHRGATIGVTTFNNVDQVDAWGTFASAQGDSATPTTTVASTTNEVVFGVMALSSSNDQTLTPGAGQTGQWDLHQDDANGAGSTESGAASVVTSWSSSSSGKWVAAGVSVNEKNAIVVDTTDDYSNLDVNYGDTTSIDALLLDKGADNLISLREAIDAANQDGGGDEIRFDLTGSGPYLITPGSPLPAITDPLIIDGWSEPDHVLAPLIEIDGTGLAGDGLTFTAGSDGSTVRGLIINGFDDAAISFTDTGNATVQGNYLGTDETGTLDPTLMTNGLLLSNSDLNTIGGTTAVERNVIAGNDLSGINLLNGSNDNIIKGNYIGITAAGSAGLSNFNGIYILDSSDNTIGGTTAGAGNVISGNADEGVEIEGATSSGNSVLGNYIGVNASGTGAIANAGNGVQIENAPSNTVGGSTAAARNVISGNTGNGVHIAGSSATLNVVLGNYIGLNVSGTGAIANQGDGVRIDDSAEGASTGAPGNIIGGSVAGAGNVISGNVGKGVVIFGTASDLNEIRGNIIGLSTDGANPMGNTDDGVSVSGGADNIVIGGTTSAQRNVISSNVGHGILISGTTTTAVTVSGNYIGTDATGTSDRGNGKQGVQISDSPGNTIGGTASGAGNVISGNAWSGVSIQLDGADSNLVQGNLIGTNFTGTAAIGNDNYGVDIFNGGPDDNTIGGTTASARNIISGNAWEGVLVKGAGTTGNTVSGNYIGTNEAGDSGVPNQLGGVVIELGATGNTIGGDAGGTGNLIAYNDGIGVKVEDAATTDNPIIGNTIHDNNGLGIDLNVDGVTANDGSGSDDIDTGPNDLMNFPLVTSVEAQLVGTSVTVDFTIDSLPSTTFRVDFFKSTEADPAHGEGEAWLGSTEVGTSPAGVVISSHTMSAALVLGDYVTATATAKSGATFLGTSEFGQNGVATFVPEVDLATGTAGYTEDDPPEPIAPFATVTDPDSADFNGGNLTVTITANATASDRLGIRDEGIGAGDIGVSGSDVKYENTTIGTFTSGTGATPLVVTLNASATVAAVQELVRNITFENTSQTPTTTPDRTIEFVLTDDEPLTGPTDTLTLTVTAQNDDPTNTGGFPGTDLTVNEEDSVPVDLSAIVLADVDVGAGDLTVRLQTSAGGTIGANPGVGITIGGTSEDLTLTGSLIDVNNYLSDNSKLEFVGPVDLFGDDADSITVTVSDNGNTGSGGGGDVSLGTWNVDITNVNDVPIISATGPATIPTGSLYTLNLSVIDPDGDSITGWTVNWGDGAIETFAGNPSSVTHTFANTGFTNNILVSMTDVVGTWAAGDLISSSLQTDSVLRFSATDGSFLQEFATGDGNNPVDVQIGPDGGIYVTGFASNNVYRYDPDGTGGTEFVLAGSGGLSGASRMAFGPDGNLYVTSWNSDEVLRYDGSSGSHIDVFADSIGNSLDQPDGMTFGPDGHLYVASRGTGEILRFDGDDGSYDQVFVTHGTIGYMDIQFGPDGDLWVTNQSTDDIRRYDGTDGSYLGPFASAPTGADDFAGIAFGADDYVYMSDAIGSNDKIVRYLVTDSNTNSDFVLSGAGGLNQPVNIVFTPAHQVTITNAPPTLTILTSPVDTTSEDTEVEVSFADLTTAGNENDVDGTVDAFVVKTISSGTLKIGATAGGATAWAAVTNDTIDVGNNAYWTPDPDATGTQNAFELVAEDDEGLESSGNVTAQIDVTAVNDDPTLTATGDDPTFVAGGASVGLYSSTSIDLVEAADRVVNVILTVAGLQDGADEILVVDGTNVALTDLNSASTGSGYGVGVAVTASTATVAVSKAGDYTAAEAQTLVDGFAYLNTAGTPTGTTRTVTITLVKDDGGTANSGVESSVPNVVSTVTIEASTDPTITSDGGGAAAAISVMENATDVTTVTATDPEAPPQVLSYSIAAGGDGAKFTVGTLTGVLSFIAAPDFEAPGDGDSDNIYDFTVEVRDGGGGLDTQAVSVTVTDSPVALPAASIPEMSATATPVDSATTSPADLVTDGTFLDAGTPAGFTTYTNGQTFGGWTVTQGKADHLGSAYDSSPLGGNSVDLGGGITGSGGEPGTISQTFATVTGQQYQVTFELSGAWFIDSLDKNLRVTFDGSSQDITISRPAGWNSSTDMKWAPQMLIFTASSTTADLSFQSLDPAGEGPIVADVQVVPDPATFAYALTDDASGRFDIHATSGLITVEDGTLLDFESAATHDVTVRVTSGGNLIGEETFAIAVTDVNDAPGLVDTAVTLASVMEDAGAPSGAVGTLVSSIVDFAGGGGQNNVTDVDSGAVTGIAVTGADTANGTWHY
ncbi:MAG: hypothetical protein CMJ18_06600, partial [Phycisphaeraceae bacterium]|nr:hypothetical protein [Phycisphaeraceae bacterium]